MIEPLLTVDGSTIVVPSNMGPGPQDLIGYYDQDLGPGTSKGFFGEVAVEELIDGSDLASMIGLTSGTAQNNTAPWLKFFIDDRIVFVAKQTYRHSVSWDHLHTVNAVVGDQVITIADHQYRIRLFKGLNPDPNVPFERGTYDTEGSWNSEWNRLMYNISEEHTNPDYHKHSQIGENWANYTQAELDITAGNGRYSWCQETDPNTSYSRISRGLNAVSYLFSNTTSSTNIFYGWRPVLELVL